jgi:hypothetical protein
MLTGDEFNFCLHIKKIGDCWIRAGNTVHINKKPILAHRYSWILHYGEIPKGFGIGRNCKNYNCVNPDHLYLIKKRIK